MNDSFYTCSLDLTYDEFLAIIRDQLQDPKKVEQYELLQPHMDDYEEECYESGRPHVLRENFEWCKEYVEAHHVL